MAEAILNGAPGARLLGIAVFGARLAADAPSLARALDAAAGADIVHCSLGLARSDPAVAAALDRLLAGGAAIVASSPARGGPVWPAAHPGVIAAQGDARCGPGAWSHLAVPQAEFGACPRLASGLAGASVGAAHLTGHLARIWAALPDGGRDREAALDALRQGAAHRGPERRVRP